MAIRPANAVDTTEYAGKTGSYYDTSKFIPELYSKKILRNFYESTFYMDVMNTDLT